MGGREQVFCKIVFLFCFAFLLFFSYEINRNTYMYIFGIEQNLLYEPVFIFLIKI